jgi:hypothetical protein
MKCVNVDTGMKIYFFMIARFVNIKLVELWTITV